MNKKKIKIKQKKQTWLSAEAAAKTGPSNGDQQTDVIG